LSWWTGGGTPNDAIGINHGTLKNGALYGAGEVGQSFDLDGVNDYVEVPDNDAWAFGDNEFTIEFWANWRYLVSERKPTILKVESSDWVFRGFFADSFCCFSVVWALRSEF